MQDEPGDGYSKNMHFLLSFIEMVNNFECYDAPKKKATTALTPWSLFPLDSGALSVESAVVALLSI